MPINMVPARLPTMEMSNLAAWLKMKDDTIMFGEIIESVVEAAKAVCYR